MIFVRNNSVLSTPVSITSSGSAVPFDTVVYNTNTATALSSNAVQISSSGLYQADCEVVLSNSASSAVTVTLQAYANGSAITGATATQTIDAGESETIYLPWTLKVIQAASGTASVSWMVSGGACTLNNAVAKVFRHC